MAIRRNMKCDRFAVWLHSQGVLQAPGLTQPANTLAPLAPLRGEGLGVRGGLACKLNTRFAASPRAHPGVAPPGLRGRFGVAHPGPDDPGKGCAGPLGPRGEFRASDMVLIRRLGWGCDQPGPAGRQNPSRCRQAPVRGLNGIQEPRRGDRDQPMVVCQHGGILVAEFARIRTLDAFG